MLKFKDEKDGKMNEDEREKSKSIKGPKFISDAEATALENWSGSAQNVSLILFHCDYISIDI